MKQQQLTCKLCGDPLSKSEVFQYYYDLEEIGYAENICDECIQMQQNPDHDIDTFSDADPGL